MRKTTGFTLIEMLIVIAVIGILAVAVLSAINPIEQMRKARDTRRRSNAAELLNALERYYATNEDYGTAYIVGDGADCATAIAEGNQVSGADDLVDLISSNELKSEFEDRIDTAGDELYSAIDEVGGTDLVTVCYQIESMANITKYGEGPAPNCCIEGGAACAGDGTAVTYVCLPE
ncbi:MAG TPA: type II secretion system protein [Candidatus Bathyarchaeia archaeon]|nr:type II secretion system protein [Candidatus Bathyarchaeia archaeon]